MNTTCDLCGSAHRRPESGRALSLGDGSFSLADACESVRRLELMISNDDYSPVRHAALAERDRRVATWKRAAQDMSGASRTTLLRICATAAALGRHDSDADFSAPPSNGDVRRLAG